MISALAALATSSIYIRVCLSRRGLATQATAHTHFDLRNWIAISLLEIFSGISRVFPGRSDTHGVLHALYYDSRARAFAISFTIQISDTLHCLERRQCIALRILEFISVMPPIHPLMSRLLPLPLPPVPNIARLRQRLRLLWRRPLLAMPCPHGGPNSALVVRAKEQGARRLDRV